MSLELDRKVHGGVGVIADGFGACNPEVKKSQESRPRRECYSNNDSKRECNSNTRLTSNRRLELPNLWSKETQRYKDSADPW